MKILSQFIYLVPNVETRKEIYNKKRIFGICFFIREYSRESSYLLIYENLFDSLFETDKI